MAKTIIQAQDIRLSFGPRTVLDIRRFTLMEGERVGLVGENGAGKTTFLRVLAGAIAPDEGQVLRFAQVNYIRQMDEGDAAPSPIPAGPFDNKAGQFSGGERTRRRIAQALAAPGCVLLADEPTADLDWQGISALEKALTDYQGAWLLVSHDRALLNKLCTRIVQLEDGKLTSFPGGYDAYLAQREQSAQYAQFQYDQYKKESARLKASAQKKREQADQVKKAPTRMGNSEARLHKRADTATRKVINQERNVLLQRLDMLDRPDRPRSQPDIVMGLGSFAPIVSRVAVQAGDLTLKVGGRTLICQASFSLPALSHTVMLGPNGCGKTTLAQRIVAGDPRIRLAPGLSIGYFGQDHQALLNMEGTLLDNAMAEAAVGQDTVRTVLARLGLKGDVVFKKVGVLSGGERAKVALSKLMVGKYNMLLLDEPTNHLDLYAMEALEKMLTGYQGTLLLITHDRQMAAQVSDRLLWFVDQRLDSFEGSLAAYNARGQAKEVEDDQIARMRLDLRLAELAGRIASPKRGDDVADLRRLYEEAAQSKKRLGP